MGDPKESVTAIVSEFPDFRVASAYEQWRNACLTNGATRAQLASRLEQTGDELALLRAAQILSVDPTQQSKAFELAGRLMCSDNPVLRLFGRYLSAFLVIRGSYHNDLEAPISAHAAIHTLHEILAQLEALTKRDPLSLELEMRVHLSLSESHNVNEDFALVQLHASKLVTLAPSVGLQSFQFSGKVMLARALLYQGNSAAALSLYEELSTQDYVRQFRVHYDIDMATALLWCGDFRGAHDLLELHAIDLGNPNDPSEAAKGVQALTLLSPPRNIAFDKLANRFSVSVKAHVKLQEALLISPLDEMRRRSFREARNLIAHSVHNQTTWLANFERAFATLCSLRAGDHGIALQSVPKIGDELRQPFWSELFSAFVTLETALRVHTTHGKSSLYRSSIPFIQALLNRTSAIVLGRALPTLQLLTPTALAFVAAIGGVDEIVIQAGLNCIVNLKTRPATVYDTPGLRPMQIVELTLEAFGAGQFGESRAGGGQLEAITACLRRAHGKVHYWFEPVLPARLVVGLLEAANTDMTPQWLSEACHRAALDLSRNFGLMPTLQKIAPPTVLTALETEINRALFGNPDPSQIWHVIRTHGGNV
jgi:hypothetical protein